MDWSNLKADYERLGTYKAVAAEYGLSVNTVGRHTREQKINSGYPWGSSPLESMLRSALMKAEIGFTAEAFVCGRYFADILLHQLPVILEADGRWHKISRERDRVRDAELTASGYKVFRFTGLEIYRDADAIVSYVISECRLNPEENPEYLIRDRFTGATNPNRPDGPRCVICSQCGKLTERESFRVSFKKVFCNRQCYGLWMGDHPDESNRRRKINWEEVTELYAQGIIPKDIMQRYDIGKTTLYRHLREMGATLRRQPKRPYIGKYSDQARINFQRGHVKRSAGGRSPVHGPDGRFISRNQGKTQSELGSNVQSYPEMR